MNNNKEIYRSNAVVKKDPKQTALALICTAAICGVVFIVSKFLPVSWLFQLAALFLCALYINKVLKQGTFVTTYILYEDKLTVVTRYGLIEMVTGEYTIGKAHFTDYYIENSGKRVPFYPDETLKKLLKAKTAS